MAKEITENGSTHYKDIKNIKIKRDKDIRECLPFDVQGSAHGVDSVSPKEDISLTALDRDGGSVPCADQNLFSDLVKGLYLTYFQNSEGKYRNVIKARFNLDNDQHPEFISFLTKRWADFQRNVDEDTKLWMNALRKEIKSDYRIHPYMGKFALKRGQSEDSPKIEPDTAIALWYDRFDEKWSAVVKFKSFEMVLHFETEYLTEKQKANNVRATALYRRDAVKRTKSWSEMNPEYK